MISQTTIRAAGKIALSMCLLVLLIPGNVSLAQRGGGRGRGGEGSWFRRVMHSASDKEILDLLKHKPIRTEIALAKEDYDKIRTLESEAMSEIFKSRKDVAECVRVMREFGEEAFGHLSDEQTERLEGLFIQTRKLTSASNARIAKKIDLEEVESFREKVRGMMFNEELKSKMRIIMDSNIPFEEKGERAREAFEKQFEEVNEKLKDHFTEEQLGTLKKLEGPAFGNLPHIPPGGRVPGGEGGGRHGKGGPPKGGAPEGGRPKGDQPPHGSPGSPTCDACGQACVVPTL